MVTVIYNIPNIMKENTFLTFLILKFILLKQLFKRYKIQKKKNIREVAKYFSFL